jgi:oligosaccharide repeat unit polymerase
MIAFFCVNFIYPVYYFPTDPSYSVFGFQFNYQIICKATSLAYVAFSIYLFGLTLRKYEPRDIIDFPLEIFSKSFFRNLLLLFLILSISYIASVGANFFSGYDWFVDQIDQQTYNPIITYLAYSSSLFAMFFFFNPDRRKKLLYSIIIISFIFIFTVSGSRTLPLGLALIIMISYNDKVKKIPTIPFLSFIILGFIVLSFIANARFGGIADSAYFENGIKATSDNSTLDFTNDLVVNNRNLYVLVDYADNHGLTFGLNMLASVIGIIPGAVTLFSNTFNIPVDFMTAAGFNTFLEFGLGSTWGLGGNMVGDVYLSFGFIGVLLAFFFLGIFVSKVISCYKTNVSYYITYCILTFSSIYMNRESFFMPLRGILFSIIIFWLLNGVISKFKSKQIN